MVVKRFQVMAVLQAARGFTLGLPIESAYSWGLNRAIFVAAARHGFKAAPHGGGKKGAATRTSKEEGTYFLGDQMAYLAPGKALLFTIGGEVQTKEAFEKQVKSRFGATFPSVWKEALEYVEKFDKETLLSGDSFFSDVYRTRRDELADMWTQAVGPSP